jgi:hypothetical protein
MRTPGGTQRANPFSHGRAGWILLGQQPPARFQLTGERQLERLAGARYHEPSVVAGTVIVGEFLAWAALIRVRVSWRDLCGLGDDAEGIA